MKNVNWKEDFSLTFRLSTSTSTPWKVLLYKEVSAITFKWRQGINLFKDFETTTTFLLNSLAITISVNFWLGSLLFFTVTTSWISLCCLKRWFPKPVSKFWALRNYSKLKIFLSSAIQLQFFFFMFVYLLNISRAFAQKQALVLGRLGIRNLPIANQRADIKFYASFQQLLELNASTCLSY